MIISTSVSQGSDFDPSRRKFLKDASATAGMFLLAVHVPFQGSEETAPPLPQGIFAPNVFLKIDADNSVTVLSKHLEMGQGAATGMATLVAEELGADWSTVRFEFAPSNDKLYNNLMFGPVMGTGGSTSTAESWVQMRKVGAAARMMFITAASAKWGLPPGEIKVEKSVISHASGRRATLGELAADAMQVPVPAEVSLKSSREWNLIGTRLPRLDSKGKTTGTAAFAMDIRRPGMLTAVLRRPALFGAKVASFDATDAKKIDGVVDVVQVPAGVAVLATDTWAAMRGRQALKVTWDTSQAETRSTAEMLEEYRAMMARPGLLAAKRGDATGGLSRATRTFEAEFTFPYLAHAPMEPLNCVVEFRGDEAEVWAGSQIQSIDQMVTAQILGLKPQQVKVNTLLAGGSFGRRATSVADWVGEAAQIAKAIQGRAPIHLVWTREDDLKGGYYRPLVLHRLKAGVDDNGRIAGWQHKVACKPLLLGTAFEAMGVKNGLDHTTVEGLADTPYAISDFEVEAYNATTPIPVLWFRSVGNTHTAHVVETTIDELAHLAGKDPLAFRLDLLTQQPRDAAVIRMAAEKAGWNRPIPKGRGRGLAYHYSFNTRVAMVAEVLASGQSIKVERIVAAVDCGVAVNPDVVRAQIEGAIGFALSMVFRNQVTFNQGKVEQSNFDDYEPTRMREMPDVEVHIVPSSQDPTGIGEPGVPPLAPAIGNAIFAATGKRLRSLPFDLSALT